MPKILGFTQSGFDPASRFRFMQFIPYLESSGWDVTHRPNHPDRQWKTKVPHPQLFEGLQSRAALRLMQLNRLNEIRSSEKFDAVFVNRDLAGAGTYFESRLLRKNPRVIYDFDDAIYTGPNEPYVRWMCTNAAWVTTGNEYLADYARQFSDRVTVIPTVIDTEKYARKSFDSGDRPKPIKVGWCGSDMSIKATLFPHLEILTRLQKQLDFELVIITNSKPQLPVLDIRWEYHQWRPDLEEELVGSLDIGIMPLVDNEYQKGKAGLKLLQYMAAGIPSIASPVGVNAEILKHGVTGFLASNETEWHEALGVLLSDTDLQASMGAAGRQRCEDEYSINKWFPEFLKNIEYVAQFDS